MEAAGLALGVVAAADLCLKYGKILVDTCKTFENAEAEIRERVLQVKSHWHRTSAQLDFLRKIWASLSDEHQAIQTETLRVLVGKLITIITKINALVKQQSPAQNAPTGGGTVKRWKYVLLKPYLDDASRELDQWQKTYDPTWYLIILTANNAIDTQLNHQVGSPSQAGPAILKSATNIRNSTQPEPVQTLPVFLPDDGLKGASFRAIPFATAQCVQRAGTDKWLVIDSIPFRAGADLNIMTNSIRTLGRKLMNSDALTFNILKSRGVLRVLTNDRRSLSSFDIVFEMPKYHNTEPRSLRDHLVSETQHTLTERFDLAKQIAKAVSFVHTLGFVHKNVCPENILSFSTQTSVLGSAFLIGFQQVRTADGRSLMQGDDVWEKNIYRHPKRQGLHPEELYSMQHDIYSLGVCLLEIGLWKSFAAYDSDGKTARAAPVLGVWLREDQPLRPSELKDHLVRLAKLELPLAMGNLYAQIVVNCLTCLDEDNVDFGDQSEFEDADGVLIGVRYIEKILSKLNNIAV